MAITISDIARIAGVSRATVSGVLNNNPSVSEKTRQRILTIIKEHDYRPNEIARALALNQTDIIGLIVKDISNPLYSKIALGVEETCAKMGYSVIIGNTQKDIQREISHINLLKRRRVDGLIIFPLQRGADLGHLFELKEENYPFVLLAEVPGIKADLVRSDDQPGAYQATKHLINLGRKRIAYITGPQNALANDRRLGSYKQALNDHNLSLNEELIRPGGWRRSDGYKAGKLMLNELKEYPDGAFCYNDAVAIGFIRALVEHGLRIPQDVAIVGFDDAGSAAYLETALTTVEQPAKEIGNKAAQLLVERIKNKKEQQRTKKILLPTSLVIRESCGANEKGSVKVF